jgi:hypothetical protein
MTREKVFLEAVNSIFILIFIVILLILVFGTKTKKYKYYIDAEILETQCKKFGSSRNSYSSSDYRYRHSTENVTIKCKLKLRYTHPVTNEENIFFYNIKDSNEVYLVGEMLEFGSNHSDLRKLKLCCDQQLSFFGYILSIVGIILALMILGNAISKMKKMQSTNTTGSYSQEYMRHQQAQTDTTIEQMINNRQGIS